MDLTYDPSRFSHFPEKASTKTYSPPIVKGKHHFLSHMETKPIKYRVFIYYYTNWLIVLLKPLMIKHDDYNVPYYAFSTDVLLA